GGTADARDEGQEDQREPRAHLACLRCHDGAARAAVYVRLAPRAVAAAEPAALPTAEAIDRPPALGLVVGAAEVRLDPRLSEPLAGTVGQRGRRIGAHADEGGDLLRLHALDLRVPEHLLPARGQRPEGLRRRRPVERVEGGGLARGW